MKGHQTKTSQDKRTRELAQSREKPQDGENTRSIHLIIKYQMFSRKRESTVKVKIKLPM